MRLAFIEGPDGVRIELVQRDNLSKSRVDRHGVRRGSSARRLWRGATSSRGLLREPRGLLQLARQVPIPGRRRSAFEVVSLGTSEPSHNIRSVATGSRTSCRRSGRASSSGPEQMIAQLCNLARSPRRQPRAAACLFERHAPSMCIRQSAGTWGAISSGSRFRFVRKKGRSSRPWLVVNDFRAAA
jgi:hypothetical protein